MLAKVLRVLCFLILASWATHSQAQSLVMYAGNGQQQRFNSVMQLSDGTILVAGQQIGRDFSWVPIAPQNLTQPPAPARIDNTNGGAAPAFPVPHFGFLLRISEDMSTVLNFLRFPENEVLDITHIKATNVPGARTGAIFISGRRIGSNPGGGTQQGYYIARLNNNFVDGVPTGIEWAWNIAATGDHRDRQPWDVGGDGKVVYAEGDPFANDWAAVRRLRADGTGLDLVPNWRYHFGVNKLNGLPAEGAWTPAFSNPNILPISSALIFKIDASARCALRSWTPAEYAASGQDENGNFRQGSWPMDTFFASHCDRNAPHTTQQQGSTMTGYRLGGTQTHRIGGLAVDKRDNHIYIGSSIQSLTSDGLPDFEPMVMAFDATGNLKWWNRLYRETTAQSPPDQYVDALGIDYSQTGPFSTLLVIARQHGGAPNGFWNGDQIAAANNPLNIPSSSFHNRFTGAGGKSGDIHQSWIGKMRLTNGKMMNSAWVAGFQGDGPFGPPQPDLDGWPSHNAGNPVLNTTTAKIQVQTDAAGNVYLIATARAFITTANAWQKHEIPVAAGGTGPSSWAPNIRVFTPDLRELVYTSALTGGGRQLVGGQGNNTDLHGFWPVKGGVLVVGHHFAGGGGGAVGLPIPITNVQPWGRVTPLGQTGIFAYLAFSETLQADFAFSPPSGACVGTPVTITDRSANAVTWVWDFDGGIATNQGTTDAGPYQVTWATAGTKNVRLTVTDGGGGTSTETIPYIITAPPSANFTTSATGPAPLNVTLTATDATPGLLYEWVVNDLVTGPVSYSDRIITHRFGVRGSYPVTLRVSNGRCTVERTTNVNITGGPEDVNATFVADAAPACWGEPVVFRQISEANVVSWRWAFGRNASPATASTPGPHVVYYTQEPGDTGERTALLTVSNGVIERSYLYTFRIESGLSADFNVAIGGGGAATFTPVTPASSGASYQWDFGNPRDGSNNRSTSASPSYTYTQGGTYGVRLRVTSPGGCVSEMVKQITVVRGSATHQADFAITPSEKVCVFNKVEVTDMSRGFRGEQRNWDFGAGAVPRRAQGARPEPVYWETPGMKVVTLTVDGDDNTRKVVSKLYEVVDYPNAAFTIEGDLCSAPANLRFVPASAPGSTYVWDFGDGSTSAEVRPAHTYAGAGTYTITLTVINNGCRSVMRRQIAIGPGCNNPQASILARPSREGCREDAWLISSATTGTIVNYAWSLGGGTVVSGSASGAGPFQLVFPTPGPHTISVTVTDDQGRTATVDAVLGN